MRQPSEPVPKVRDLLWRRTKLKNVPRTFTGTTSLSNKITILQTPYQFFKYLFDEELMDKIVEERVKYSVSKNAAQPHTFSKNDLLRYLGMYMYSITSCFYE